MFHFKDKISGSRWKRFFEPVVDDSRHRSPDPGDPWVTEEKERGRGRSQGTR